MKPPRWLIDRCPQECLYQRWHVRVCRSLSRREDLTALWGIHWFAQLAVWIQHRWAIAAHAPSLLERWTDRQFEPCQRLGHLFGMSAVDVQGRGKLIHSYASFGRCLRCGTPAPGSLAQRPINPALIHPDEVDPHTIPNFTKGRLARPRKHPQPTDTTTPSS
jgi:hypothetical protein